MDVPFGQSRYGPVGLCDDDTVLPFGSPFASELPTIELARVAGPESGEGWPKRTWDHAGRRFLVWDVGRVAALSERLVPLGWSNTPPNLPLDGGLAASDDCRAVAALTLDRLVVAADGAQTLEIRCDPGWDGRVVVGAVGFPWGDRRLAAVLPTDDPTSYRLLVVNAGGGEIRYEELFASEPAGFSIHGHPSGDGLIVEGGVGQEGTGLWTVRETPTGIAMEALPQWDRVFAGFSPGGVEILTTPHLGRDLVVHRWPDWGPVATIPATGVFALDGNEPVDRFDFFAGYLSVDSILAKSAEYGRLVLLDRRTGFPSHEVRVPGLDPDNDGATALHSFTTLATGHLVTWSWHGIEAAMHVWMPPRELAGGERPRA